MSVLDQIKSKFPTQILNCVEKNSQRVYIDIKRSDLIEVVKYIFNDLNCRFSIASGVDTREGIEILYHFSDDTGSGTMFSIRVTITDKDNPEVDSLTGVIVGSSWIEREMHELLGINFKGHPDLKPLLLPEDWPNGNYPLRRDQK